MRRLFTLVIYCLTFFYLPAQAQEVTSQSINQSNDLEQITRSILRKQLELERLNTQFRIETTLVSPWRQRRMFAYGESNASLVESGLITGLPVWYRLARRKIPRPPVDNKNRNKLITVARLQLIGQSIGAGGDVLELGLNFINYCFLRKKGFNPSAYCKQATTIQAELDNLLEQRCAILNQSPQLSANEIKVAQAEGKLLSDLRDLSLLEYKQYISATKRFWAFQNTAFLVDFLKNSVGASGNILALEANHVRRIHWLGTSFLLSTISGAIVIVTPVVGRVTGNVAGLAAEKTASKGLLHIHTSNSQSYLSDRQEFLHMVNSTPADGHYLVQVNKRKHLYEQQGSLFISQEQFLKDQREQARRTLKENILFAAVVGPPRIATGTLGMIGFWHYYNNSPDRNRCLAGGQTAYLAGTAFNMLETARVQASVELNNRKLAKSNLLPRQQFARRLQLIENMDKDLTK